MKWVLELSDVPLDARYPIVGHQILDNGVQKGPFYYRVKDIVEALTQEVDSGKERYTPILPRGTILYATNEKYHRVVIEVSKRMWDIRYQEEQEIHCIGFPRMIVEYLVTPHQQKQKYRITRMKIYSVFDKEPITEETVLYYFPYPNVGNDGTVCWGNNGPIEIHSLVELEKTFLWFVSAPFNEDYGVKTTLGINHFKTLIPKIEDKPFNDEWLIPTKFKFKDVFIK